MFHVPTCSHACNRISSIDCCFGMVFAATRGLLGLWGASDSGLLGHWGCEVPGIRVREPLASPWQLAALASQTAVVASQTATGSVSLVDMEVP